MPILNLERGKIMNISHLCINFFNLPFNEIINFSFSDMEEDKFVIYPWGTFKCLGIFFQNYGHQVLTSVVSDHILLGYFPSKYYY